MLSDYLVFLCVNWFIYIYAFIYLTQNPMKGRSQSAGTVRLPPIPDRNHPAYAYQFLNGRYVKINLKDQSVIDDNLLENYSFE